MSIGSYQQFCEQRRHMASATTGDVGMSSFDIQLPPRYPGVANRMPPTEFYGAAPGIIMQPPRAGVSTSQLPSSFFTSQDAASQPLMGNSNYCFLPPMQQ